MNMPRIVFPVIAIVAILGALAVAQKDSSNEQESAKAEKALVKEAELAAKAEAEAAELAAKAEAEAAELAAKAEAKAKAEAAELAAKVEAEAAELAAKAEAKAADIATKAEAVAAESAAMVTGAAATVVASADDSSNPQYVVKDGLVDKATFNGYRRFHGTCHACHGQDAAGGSFAPSLVESLKTMDYTAFRETVVEGRQNASASGGVNVMPAFSNDPNVMKHLDDIYRYVAGRSDGVIGTGRPGKIPK